MNLEGRVYLSHDDVYQQEDPEAPEPEIIRLNAKEFYVNQGRTHAFFSHFRPDYLFTELTKKMQ